jgi:hypothetical protein
MPAVTSAAGLLTLLEDDNDELKQYALVNLDKVVHEYWYQISASIASVEALYEDEEFRDRELAALIASKVGWLRAACFLVASQHASWQLCPRQSVPQVFYHLGELDSALTYALGAGKHFDVNEQSEYVQTLIGGSPPSRPAAGSHQDPRTQPQHDVYKGSSCDHGMLMEAPGAGGRAWHRAACSRPLHATPLLTRRTAALSQWLQTTVAADHRTGSML